MTHLCHNAFAHALMNNPKPKSGTINAPGNRSGGYRPCCSYMHPLGFRLYVLVTNACRAWWDESEQMEHHGHFKVNTLNLFGLQI